MKSVKKDNRPLWQVIVSLFFSIVATVTVVLIVYYGLSFLMPFVIGWVIAAIASPLVNLLERRLKIVKALSSALIVALVIAIVVVALYFGISFLVREIQNLLVNMPDLYAQAEQGFNQIGETLSGLLAVFPEGFQHTIANIGSTLEASVGDFITEISQPTVAAAGNLARNVPSILVSILVSILSAYFFIVHRDLVVAMFQKVAPVSVKTRMTMVMVNLRKAVGGYFKAQFKIMLVVYVVLLIGLAIGQVRFFVIIALLIAILDMLPVFGTGTVMIPWILYALLIGDIRFAIILAITYVLTNIAHNLLQPKLVSDSLDMHPIVALLLIYIGFRFSGIGGMILAIPVGMIIINLVKAGAFAYITDDITIIVDYILSIRGDHISEEEFEELKNGLVDEVNNTGNTTTEEKDFTANSGKRVSSRVLDRIRRRGSHQDKKDD